MPCATPPAHSELRRSQRRDACLLWVAPLLVLGGLFFREGLVAFPAWAYEAFVQGLVLILQDIRTLNTTLFPGMAALGGTLVLHLAVGAIARDLLVAALVTKPGSNETESAGNRELTLAAALQRAKKHLGRKEWLMFAGTSLALLWCVFSTLAVLQAGAVTASELANLGALVLGMLSLNWPRTWASLNTVASSIELLCARLNGEPRPSPVRVYWCRSPDSHRFSALELPLILEGVLSRRHAELLQSASHAT